MKFLVADNYRPDIDPDEPDGPIRAASPPNARRADLHLILAFIILAAALTAIISGARGETAGSAPPELAAAPALYRPDGGQSLSPDGRLRPNELTELNLGRQIRLDRARPEYLAHLPGLGPKNAVKGRERGCLTKTQRQNLTGLVIESCDPNKP